MKRFLTAIIIMLGIIETAGAIEHFAWGADISTSVDVSGNDMSTVNLDACLGYKNSFIDIAGVGAGINMMVSNSSRAFPVYAIVRTSFRSKPSLCFLDFRCGAAFNSMSDGTNHTATYVAPGIGFNLAMSKTFKSFIVVSYTYNGMKDYMTETGLTDMHGGAHLISARFGVTF